jgi:flagellar export protein FliJ
VAFHFPLQPVLRLRHSLEERERLRLAVIIGYLNQLNQRCEELDQQKAQISSALAERLNTGVLAIELHVERARILSLERWKNTLLQQKAKLEEQRVVQEQALIEAQRKRKVLENLHDLRFEIYRQEQQRREQQRVDDLFGQRFAESAKQ